MTLDIRLDFELNSAGLAVAADHKVIAVWTGSYLYLCSRETKDVVWDTEYGFLGDDDIDEMQIDGDFILCGVGFNRVALVRLSDGSLVDRDCGRSLASLDDPQVEACEGGVSVAGQTVRLPFGRLAPGFTAAVVGNSVVINDLNLGLVVANIAGGKVDTVPLRTEPYFDPSPMVPGEASVLGVLSDGRLIDVHV